MSSPNPHTTSVKKAVLLAAGRGQRLAPYTDHLPKPMIRLAGRPLLEYILLHLRQIGVSEVLIITGHLGEQIRAYFGPGTGVDLQLHYAAQPSPRGTGAATLLAESFVGPDCFLLGWGDIIVVHANYQALATSYREEPVDGLLLLEYVADPHTGAAVYLDGRRISAIVEKPPAGSSSTHWNQAGLAVYTPEIFSCLHETPISERGEREFTGAVQVLIERGRQVCGLPQQAPRLHLTRPPDIPATETVLRQDPRYLAGV